MEALAAESSRLYSAQPSDSRFESIAPEPVVPAANRSPAFAMSSGVRISTPTFAVETACPLPQSHKSPTAIRSTSSSTWSVGNNWPFERAGEDELAIVVTGRWTNYQVSFTWMSEIEALHLACAFDMRVPELRLVRSAAAYRADQRANVDRTFRCLDAKRRGDVPPCAAVVRRRRRIGPAMRGSARHRARFPASVISRRSSSWSGRANPRAKPWTPRCSRPPARHSRRLPDGREAQTMPTRFTAAPARQSPEQRLWIWRSPLAAIRNDGNFGDERLKSFRWPAPRFARLAGQIVLVGAGKMGGALLEGWLRLWAWLQRTSR